MTAKTKRVQMDLTENSFNRLKRLKELVEVNSYSTVMKDAIRLYEYVLMENERGSTFWIEDKEGEKTSVKII